MPWSSQGGGSGSGPWGRSPGGGGRRGGGGQPPPPDLEEMLRRSQDRFRRWMPGLRGGAGLILLLLVVIGIWLLTGFYRVEPDEQGSCCAGASGQDHPARPQLPPALAVRDRHQAQGDEDQPRRDRLPDPGRFPARRLHAAGAGREPDAHRRREHHRREVTVFWRIRDAGQYLFNIQAPERTVKDAAESAMREVIGKSRLQSALAEERLLLAQQTHELTQQIRTITGPASRSRRWSRRDIAPPEAVIAAFRDVQAARADQERAKNEAEAYRNDIIPRARGAAERLVQEGTAYKEEVVARAQGEAARFLSVYSEYAQNMDVVRRRMYLETMEEVLGGIDKIIIDSAQGGSGVVPTCRYPSFSAGRIRRHPIDHEYPSQIHHRRRGHPRGDRPDPDLHLQGAGGPAGDPPPAGRAHQGGEPVGLGRAGAPIQDALPSRTSSTSRSACWTSMRRRRR